MKPVVRNIKTNDLYTYEGENVFVNIRTGVGGKVSDVGAKNTFKVNIEATQLINAYPLISEMIKSLDLKFVKNDKSD